MIQFNFTLYPVNKFAKDCWSFDQRIDADLQIQNISLQAYAIFKFLIYTNFIYSLKEIQIVWSSCDDRFEKDLLELLEKHRDLNKKLIRLKVSVKCFYPNVKIINHTEDLKCVSYSYPHYHSYNELYEKVTNSKAFDSLPLNQLNDFIFKLTNGEEKN